MNHKELALAAALCAGASLLAACSSNGSKSAADAGADARSTEVDGSASEGGALDGAPDAGWRTVLDDDLPLSPAAGLAPTPPMGWNSWNALSCDRLTATAVQAAADIIVSSGMKDAGYQYVNIDDCWSQATRAADGSLQPAANFPNGIQPVADYVHSKGLKVGIYSDRGTLTCGSRAGSQGHESQDATTFAGWGIDYLKYDNCFAALDMKTQYQTMRDALAATGRPIVFSLCSWQFDEWDLATGQLWRTTQDIAPNWTATTAGVGSIMFNLTRNQKLAAYAGPNEWNDPDMLEVGNGMTFTEDQAHFTMWAMMAAPLIAGNTLTAMLPGTARILTNTDVIAIDQDPLGFQGVPVRVDGDLVNTDMEVWAKPLNANGARAVVLFNPGSAPQSITAHLTEIGLAAGSATVRDLWQHTDLGSFTDTYTANVPSHGVVALKVSGTEPPIPTGTASLSDLAWTYASDGVRTVARDASPAGTNKTISLRGRTYAKGLGVAAPSMIVYRLGKLCTSFSADVGIDDEAAGRPGSVVFQVWADHLGFADEKLYDSGVVTATDAAKPVRLDVTGRRRLKLLVTNAGDGPSWDHGDWAGATIVCP